MAKTRKKEQHIAVFGESGSGKTILLSSFFGATQEPAYIAKHRFNVVANDVGQGSKLLQNYYKMRNSAQVPAANKLRAHTYEFTIKPRNPPSAKEKKTLPFDELGLVWHDYPGEWFESGVSGPEEAKRRIETFRSLLVSDVALLLIDGQKLADNAGEEERYLKTLFGSFSNTLNALKGELLTNGEPLSLFPRIWILALSKADVLPGMSTQDLQQLVTEQAAGHLDSLRTTIKSYVKDPDAVAVGEDLLILSSAKFEPGTIDVSERIGVDLIMPIAAVLPLERFMRWAKLKDKPAKWLTMVLDKGDGFGAAAVGAILLGATFIQKAKLPGPLAWAPAAIAMFVTKDNIDKALSAVDKKLREAHEQAVLNQQELTAILTRFRIDLEEAEDRKVLSRSLR